MDEKKNMKGRKEYIIGNIILAIVLTIFFFVMGTKKQITFCDEVYTYESANSDAPAVQSYNVLDSKEWVTGEQVREWLSASKLSWFLYSQVSYHLYKDHVPLYFLLFRTVSVLFFSGSCTKWIGLVCNYPFYIGLGIFLYSFLRKRFSYKLAFPAALFVMLHPCMISQMTMIRMYLMFTSIIVFFMLQINEKQLGDIKYRLAMGLVLAAGFLTHYHFWLFVIAFSGFYVLSFLIRKEYKQIFYYMQVCAVGLLVTTICYPDWRVFIVGGNGETSIQTLLGMQGFLEHIKAAFQKVLSVAFIGHYMIGGVVLCMLLALYLYLDRFRTKKFYIITGAVILQTLVLAQSSSFKGLTERYYWPVIGTLLIGIAYILCFIFQWAQQYISEHKHTGVLHWTYGGVAVLVLLVLYDIYALQNPDNILYFYARSDDETEQILQLTDVPWIIFNDGPPARDGFMDFTYADEMRVVPLEAAPSADEKLENADKVVVFTIDDQKGIDDCVTYLEGCSNHAYGGYERIAMSGLYSVYVIE